MEAFVIFLALIVTALLIRLFAGEMDADRIDQYVRQRGGKLLHKRWAPFGKGWFGEKKDRIYEIRYRDKDGNIREATVKTSMLAGVYFTQDRIIRQAVPLESPGRSADENERLRKRIAELENRES
ncbi:MAG: hypothetical protein KDA87_16870 [Planctomycetales bacterium]|nr:hypothetical protein [Planctomycetales bacterium]